MRRPTLTLGVAAAALMLSPSPVAAQTPTSDPDADSPSGHVYELGLDSARSDAAPKRQRSEAPGASTPSSSRDESDEAPAEQPPAESSPTSDEDAPASREKPVQTSAIRSENGFGSSSKVPGVDPPTADEREEAPAPTAAAAATSDPSGGRVYGVLVLGVLLAAGVGVASRSARRR